MIHRDTSSDLRAYVPAVDGLRALSILWMMWFHSFFIAGYYVSSEQYCEWARSWLLIPFFQGHFGVDIFFVLSGYLIARILLAEQKSPEGIYIRRFYVRRLTRILPAYLLTIGLSRYILDEAASLQTVWANILLINNFLPFEQQTLTWSWSLAVEEQFYFVFPVLLLVADRIGAAIPVLNRGRKSWLWIGLALLVLAFFVRASLVFGSFHNFVRVPNPFHPNHDHAAFVRYFDLIYDKPYGRYGAILCGVLVAYLEGDGVSIDWLRRAARWRRGLLAISTGVMLCVLCRPSYSPPGDFTQDLSAMLLLVTDRYCFAMCIGYVLLYVRAQEQGATPSGLYRFLSWQGFRPIAELSYGAYLLHPLVILALWSKIETATTTSWKPIRFGMMAQLITFALASLMYVLIERPCRRWGRNLSQSMGSLPAHEAKSQGG